MDYLKYLRMNTYEKGVDDCWTFIQLVFRDEENINLPDIPIMVDYSKEETKLKSNFKYKILDKPHKGCLLHVSNPKSEHVGYALSEKEYIHKSYSGVRVSPIPKHCIIYEVIK